MELRISLLLQDFCVTVREKSAANIQVIEDNNHEIFTVQWVRELLFPADLAGQEVFSTCVLN